MECSKEHPYFLCRWLARIWPSIHQAANSQQIPQILALSYEHHEVAVVARLVSKDAKTTTGRNLLNLRLETGLNVVVAPLSQSRNKLSFVNLPAPATWKLYLLEKYLKIRNDLNTSCGDTAYIDDLIRSLCSS